MVQHMYQNIVDNADKISKQQYIWIYRNIFHTEWHTVHQTLVSMSI